MMEVEIGKNEEFVDLIFLERLVDNFLFCSIFFRNFCSYFFERIKCFLFLGVFLKFVVYVVGFWNFSKGYCGIMVVIVLLLDVYYFFEVVYYVFVCGYFSMFFDFWMCVNVFIINILFISISKVILFEFLYGVELISILFLVFCFVVFLFNFIFFWCMWNLK